MLSKLINTVAVLFNVGVYMSMGSKLAWAASNVQALKSALSCTALIVNDALSALFRLNTLGLFLSPTVKLNLTRFAPNTETIGEVFKVVK